MVVGVMKVRVRHEITLCMKVKLPLFALCV